MQVSVTRVLTFFISEAPANTIGGTTTGSANVISANGQAGIHILNLGASANLVQGNRIGTDAGGGLDRGNSQHGVWIDGAPSNVIGGTVAAARNVISGNNGTGVTIQGGGATSNQVRGNRIGTDAAGTAALGNTSDGTRISGNANSNSVGGATAGAGNTIANNGAGVVSTQASATPFFPTRSTPAAQLASTLASMVSH